MILYLDEEGNHTTDPTKAVYGEVKNRKELRGPRFRAYHTGREMVWEEQECGQPRVSTKPKRGGNAEKATSKSTRSVKSASNKG